MSPWTSYSERRTGSKTGQPIRSWLATMSHERKPGSDGPSRIRRVIDRSQEPGRGSSRQSRVYPRFRIEDARAHESPKPPFMETPMCRYAAHAGRNKKQYQTLYQNQNYLGHNGSDTVKPRSPSQLLRAATSWTGLRAPTPHLPVG